MSCGKNRLKHSSSTDHIFVNNSLLKYESPRLITHTDRSDEDLPQRCRATISSCCQSLSVFYDHRLHLLDTYSELCRPADVLDFLFPPREWTDKYNHKYIECVSRHPATQFDVFNLETNLNERLKKANALEVGLCDRRRTIYDQCFDELVRQVTIECSERGILLSRIRYNYRQMLKHYFGLYVSANAYGMRTLILNEQMKSQMNDRIDHLQFDIEQLRKQLSNAEDHLENVLKLYSRLKFSIEQRQPSVQPVVPVELEQLRANNELLKQELEEILQKKLNR